MDHGLSVHRHGLTLARLPAGCQYIHRKASELRNALERELVSQRGEATLPDLAVINTVAIWTVHGLLCARWLQKAGETLSHSERLAYSRDVARAAAERERAISRLGLRSPRDIDPWAAILVPTAPEDALCDACEPSGVSRRCEVILRPFDSSFCSMQAAHLDH